MNTSVRHILDSRLGTELSAEEAEKLADLMVKKNLRGGEYLIEEGKVDDALHVLVDGNLEVVKRTASDVRLPAVFSAKAAELHRR